MESLTSNLPDLGTSIETLKSNPAVIIVAMWAVSSLFFYMTGESKTYQQKQKLRSDSIRNGLFVSLVGGLVISMYMNTESDPLKGMSDALADGFKDMDNFTTGLPDF